MASMVIGEKRNGAASLKQSGQNGLSFSSSVTFLVVTDDKNTSREQVMLQTTGLPLVGVLYGPLAATCISMSAERDEVNPLYWHVTCEFETSQEEQKQDPANPQPDPTTWIPILRVSSFVTKEIPLWEDKTPAADTNQWGAAGPAYIRNSAGQPFDEPPVEVKKLPVVPFVQFEDPNQTLKDIMARNNSVNKTAWNGYAARTLLVNVTGAELGYYGGYYAWRVEHEFIYDEDTHDLDLLDVGTCYKNGATLSPYMDETNTYQILGKLDGAGAKKTGDDYEILTFKTKKQIEFSTYFRS